MQQSLLEVINAVTDPDMSTTKKVATIITATAGSIIAYSIGAFAASLFLPGLGTLALLIVVNMLVALMLSLATQYLLNLITFRYYLKLNKEQNYV